MSARNYARLDVVTFGRQLLTSGDLDPCYLGMTGVKREQYPAWLVAYCLFYNAGFASWASELSNKEYWPTLAVAAENVKPCVIGGRWPRGTERRHFRGQAAIKTVQALRKRYATPEQMLDFLVDGPLDIKSVIARVKTHPLFGSWGAFKVADLIDATGLAKVEQDDLEVFLYDTPRASILEKWKSKQLPLKAKEEGPALQEAMAWLGKQLSDCRIPHKPKLKPDLFALETIWCKHHSHMHGHYHLNKDTLEIHHGVVPWTAISKTARDFKNALPEPPGCLMW